MTFKDRLHQTKDRMTMHVLTVNSAAVSQAVAAAGADAVIIDMEHGAMGYDTAHAMIAATQGTHCAPLVRIAALDETLVKRSLDLGAEGIVFPLIETAEQAARAVASLQYPPKGTRAFGPFHAHSRFGQSLPEHAATFGDRVICVLLVETAAAVDQISEICQVPGIDLILPAPFDLSCSLGVPGQFDHPDFLAARDTLETAIRAAGIPMGTIALDEPSAKAAFARGNRVIAGFDVHWIKAKTAEAQAWCRATMDSAKPDA